MIRVLIAVIYPQLASEVEQHLANVSDVRLVGGVTDVTALTGSIRALHPALLILDDNLPPHL